MKRILFSIALCLGAIPASAAIEILYLAPNDTAPVLGSISTDSDAFKEATPVEGKPGWMEVIRKDYFSGFIARDSLTGDGEVEIGTALLLTPSRTGTVLTTIAEGDEVSVNMVDDWTEITVFKEIPGYFQPINEEERETARRNAPAPTSLTFAEDPLLDRARGTRYTPPPLADPAVAGSGPVAARGTTLTAEPMTGFEEVDTLNPAFGRTAPDGSSRGFSLGAGSTPIPASTAADGSSTFRSGSMQDPTSIARIPAENPEEIAPTQSEEVTELQVEESGPSVDERMADLEQRMAGGEGEEAPSDEGVPAAAEAESVQDAAASEIEEPIPAPVEEEAVPASDRAAEEIDEENAEIIPLAPSGDATTSVAATAATTVVTTTATTGEVVEETPTDIIEPVDEVEVTEEVAEARVPGVTPPPLEAEPPLIPPTDTNRTYIGRLQLTKAGFFGGKPPERFELVNFAGDRIAYVNLDDVPMSGETKFIDRIVRVYGVMSTSPEKKDLTIQAANITLR